MSINETNPLTWLQAAGTVINVGALLFFIFAFYRGDIVARPVVDRIIAQYERQIDTLSSKYLTYLENVERRLEIMLEKLK